MSREGSVYPWAGAIGARQEAVAATKKKTIEGKSVVMVVVIMKIDAWLKVGIERERWQRLT